MNAAAEEEEEGNSPEGNQQDQPQNDLDNMGEESGKGGSRAKP